MCYGLYELCGCIGLNFDGKNFQSCGINLARRLSSCGTTSKKHAKEGPLSLHKNVSKQVSEINLKSINHLHNL